MLSHPDRVAADMLGTLVSIAGARSDHRWPSRRVAIRADRIDAAEACFARSGSIGTFKDRMKTHRRAALGAEILGGSEYHCRLIAERLAPRHQVEVLTTCAADYITWKNEYPEGSDRVRGVTVRRFANARTRDIQAFNRYSEWIFNNPHSRDDEIEWLRQQGPWCPSLLEYLEKNQAQYDVLICFTYLYAPTVLGVRIAPHKTILVPTAHDEPAIHLEIYKELFSLPAGMAYNTRSSAGSSPRTSRSAPSRRNPWAAASTCRSPSRTPVRPPRRRRRRRRRPRRARRRERLTIRRRPSGRTSRIAAPSSGAGIVCMVRSCSTAGGSTPARAARS